MVPLTESRVAQRKRAGPITQRSMDRNHPLLIIHFYNQQDSMQSSCYAVLLLPVRHFVLHCSNKVVKNMAGAKMIEPYLSWLLYILNMYQKLPRQPPLVIMNPKSVVAKGKYLGFQDLEIVLVKAETPGKFAVFTLAAQ